MKTFIRRVIVFSLILLGYLALTGAINYAVYSRSGPGLDDCSILIDGDSHTLTSLDPEMFDDAKNISQTAEPYVVTYWKLKEIFSQMVPDTLILGFSPHNISAFNDMKFSDKTWSTEIFSRIYPIQDLGALENIEVDYAEYYRVLLKETCLFPRADHDNYVGEYESSDISNLSDLEEAVERHYFYQGEEAGISETAVSYLDSVIDLCEEAGVTPIITCNPVHESYYERIPDIILERFEEELSDLREEGVLVIDMTTEDYPDSLFMNVDHLNEKGAKVFTEAVIRLIIPANAADIK